MPGLKSSLNKNHLETKIVAVSNTEEFGGYPSTGQAPASHDKTEREGKLDTF